ncbi:MAG: hypothetical protein ACI9WS_002111 [Paraglaciecola psychrophila]|jgi:hypothetical protein
MNVLIIDAYNHNEAVMMIKFLLFLTVTLLITPLAFATEYPNMVGVWQGNVRIVSSGDDVAKGGAVISNADVTVSIEYQDEETFLGNSRSSTMRKGQASLAVWGAMRSTGSEAIFVNSDGSRGNLWMKGKNSFEYCLTNLLDGIFTAYCGVLKKKIPAS